jgi:hypothetical protein
VKLAFAGDIGLTARLMPGPESRVSQGVADILRSCDLAVGNLELPIRPRDATVAPYSHPTLLGRVEAWPLLAGAGFKALCMASNHCLDSGRKGIAFTQYLAARDGLAVFGAGLDEARARAPAIVEVRGRKVAFLGYCKKGPFTASGSRAGAALLSNANLEADIPAIRGECDVLVVSIHAGMEFMEEPHPSVIRLAALAIDLGADCVVGHHPHVAQPVMMHAGRPVFCSLGNFLFDNRAGAAPCDVQWKLRHRGLIAAVTFAEGAAPGFELIGIDYDPDELCTRLVPGSPECPGEHVADSASGEEADCRGLGRIARREASTILELARIHGPAFLASLAGDLRPRHLRMLWNYLARRKGATA